MKRRRSRSSYYTGEREYRYSPPYLRRGEAHFQDSSDSDLDFLVGPVAAPAFAPIHRFPDFESDPAPRSPWAEPVAWVEYPPNRPTPSQERRKPAGRPSPPNLSLTSLLRPFFRDPGAGVCVRRKERREVIFALKGGGRGMPPRKRTEESNYSCGPR